MPTSPAQTPKSATYTRSSLGLFSGGSDGMGGVGATSPRSPAQQRSATTIGATTVTVAEPRPEAAADAGDRRADAPERRRASRRQSEDTMRAMRSLDRQYGRRRRLNSDYPRADASEPTSVLPPDGASQRNTASNASGSRARQPLRRGDSRALFAPLCLPHAETVLAVNVSPSYAPLAADAVTSPGTVVPAGGGSARLARQLMMIAGRLAQGPSLQGPVRPRASMPLINGAHRPLQRNRSHVTRRTRDELSDALTMKSVEIRGGRIVLDDPSSSDDSASEGYASSSDEDEAARIFGRQRRSQRARLGSVASAAPGPDSVRRPSVGSSLCASAAEAQHWEDDLRRRWYTRRCLAARQPFASVHRLAQAEHASQAPLPLLNDMRRVLAQTSAQITCGDLAGTPVDVLLCTDAILICAPHEALRVIEFSDDLAVRVSDASDSLVHISDEEHQLALEFAGCSARPWVENVVQAQARLGAVLQDLRLDEEDYVDRPPLPLLARGRSSIAGTAAHADNVLSAAGGATPHRMRNAAQGGVYWVPDRDTHVCMVCHKTAFSMMVRRHHCRACGLIICYRCSTVDKDRHRLCVRCNPTGRQSTDTNVPKQVPSLHTLGRRAAEYLPSGDVVMQMAAQREAATTASAAAVSSGDQQQALLPAQSALLGRRKNDRLVRRPVSSLFTPQDPTN
ncbi:hypothetical protein GGI20_000643 [Coemansia sp. BCRC 34301]|nr:hypothetical protein GGI20_000643 [Coemansia sp. BCRC 34301]